MQLMLINPKKRGKKTMKKRRTLAQKRATKKLVAFNKARSKTKRNPASKRKAAPKRKRVATYAKSRTSKKRPSARLIARRKANTKRKYYPNPSNRKITLKNVINDQVKPAVIGASGALILDVGYGYFGSYVPAMLNNGMLKHATKSIVAIGMGMLASNFVKSPMVNTMVRGAMTVTVHDAMKEAMTTFMPSIPMGSVDYYSPSPVGFFSDDAGNGYQNGGTGYFSSDSGDGYTQPQQSTFDTSSIEG